MLIDFAKTKKKKKKKKKNPGQLQVFCREKLNVFSEGKKGGVIVYSSNSERHEMAVFRCTVRLKEHNVPFTSVVLNCRIHIIRNRSYSKAVQIGLKLTDPIDF